MHRFLLAALFALALPVHAQTRVSALPAASALTGTELVYCVQGSLDRKCTATQLKTFAQSGLGATYDPLGAATAAQAASQPLNANLTAIAALTTTAYGRAFLELANGAAGRTALGLGTLATQNGTFSGTSSGTNTGDQDLSGLAVKSANLSDLTSASTARTNLGLGALSTVTPGTGIATALGINVGTAGAPVINGGAGGTPSSLTLTNATGLPPAGVAGTAAVLGANTFTGAQLAEQAGGDQFTARFNSSNARGGIYTAGSSGVSFVGSNLSYSSGNTFNYDKTGVMWYIGDPAGDGRLNIAVASGTAGGNSGTGTDANVRIFVGTTGDTSLLSTTDSTSPTTGALTVAGGFATVKSANIGAGLTIGGTAISSANKIIFNKAVTTAQGYLPAMGQQSHDGSGSDLALAATSSSGVISFFTGVSNNSGEIGTGSNSERVRIDGVSASPLIVYGDATINGLTVGRGAGNLSGNAVIGLAAFGINTTGDGNVVAGYAAAYVSTTGSNNVFVGRQSGYGAAGVNANTTGSYNVHLGANTVGSTSSNTNETVIGANAVGNGSNSMTFGDTNMTKYVFTAGNVGIGTAPGYKLEVAGKTLLNDIVGVNIAPATGSTYSLKVGGANEGAIWATADVIVQGGIAVGTTTRPTGPLQVVGLASYASNALALAGGLTAGAFYRNGDAVMVVH